jgi:hypothetical protein
MAYCTRCGSQFGDETELSGLCTSCSSTQGTDVPCQRCGMYLPPHELRMWNSRLYCSYCIMDLQDEERRMHAAAKHEEPPPADSRGGPSAHGGKDALPLDFVHKNGTCERCGREVGTLYVVNGRRLCLRCYSEGSSGTSSAPISGMGQIVVRVKRLLGIKVEPRIIPIEKKNNVFDTQTRKMVEKREGIHAQQLLSDGKRAKDEKESNEKARMKNDPKAKKTFFFEHSGVKKKEEKN